MRKTHEQKIREARQMMTLAEIRAGVPTFSSRAWVRRKRAKRIKQYKQWLVAQRKHQPPQPRVEKVEVERGSVWKRILRAILAWLTPKNA